MIEHWACIAALAALALPAAALAALGLSAASPWRAGERAQSRIVGLAFTGGALGLVVTAADMLRSGDRVRTLSLGDWFSVGHHGFPVAFALDGLSVSMALLGAVLTGLVAAFSARYLHRERGFGRFFLLLTVLGLGVQLAVLGSSLELLLFGWELVGLSSALLIAYFDERIEPVRNALRAYMTYRACDIGLLAAVVWLHHTTGTAAFAQAPQESWVGLAPPASATDVALVGLLLCWAAMGKSAQVPLGGWLPRAMEGPTPSSAIFYGALSIHLGPYLLLRAAPILDAAPVAAAAVAVVGGLTALHATFVGRVQTDIKSALAYASMTQVGIILVEIGLGLRLLPLLHIIGHASVRTLQLLRAPSLLHDHHHLEQAMGSELPRSGGHLERLVPSGLQPWLYRLALERGYFDALLSEYVVGSAVRFLRQVDRLEQRWTSLLGQESQESHEPSVPAPKGANR